MKRDVVIIGGGVIGSAIARELSKYKLDITLVEKAEDVATGVSKANSGIVHAGFNEKVDTLKGKLTVEGNKMYSFLSKELDFGFKRNGALVLAFNEEEVKSLEELKANGEALSIPELEIVAGENLHSLDKNISKDAIAALYAKTSGIVNPYEVTIALAENAATNGVEFLFNSKVVNVEKRDGLFFTTLENGQVLSSKIVINAAGLFSDEINNMINKNQYTHSPLKGEYILLDKVAGKTIEHTIFKVPSKVSKGVLVTPTADGNLLVGPTATEALGKDTTENAKSSIDYLKEMASLSVSNIPFNRSLNTFSGIRPNLSSKDFVIEDIEKGFISLVGIASPGLTAAPAIATYVCELISSNLELIYKKDFNPYRRRMIRFTELSLEDKNALIKENPSYGKIVCKCELITEGEIIDALKRPLGAKTLDGIKRRTRATMGGCQGIGCMLPVVSILCRELNIPFSEASKNSATSNLVGFKEV